MSLPRLAQLFGGLALYGASTALLVRSGLGLSSWAVFHEGLARQTGLSMGLTVNLVGALVLLVWIPLRQRPGLGTISNVVVIGLAMDATLAVLPAPEAWVLRGLFMLLGIGLTGVATAAYIGAGYGPGPRDGLTTGLVRLTGISVGRARTGIELAVLAVGWLLGGTVGIGTLAYTLAIGPLMQALMPMFRRGPATPGRSAPAQASPARP